VAIVAAGHRANPEGRLVVGLGTCTLSARVAAEVITPGWGGPRQPAGRTRCGFEVLFGDFPLNFRIAGMRITALGTAPVDHRATPPRTEAMQ